MHRLEVISRSGEGPVRHGPGRPPPLLFVHGAFAGAWVWEPCFLPFFADQGYEAHAVSLRGHGGSSGRADLMGARLRDYVADVETVMERLPAPPVLIGHSMGGVVVQHLMHRHKDALPGAVLLASGPPHGMIGSFWNMAIEHPGLLWQVMLAQTMGPMVADMSAVRSALFSEHTPDEIVHRFMPRLDAESAAVALDLLGLDLPPSRRMLGLPVLVLGAENDPFVYGGALDETAKTYGTTAQVFPGMAHAMMIDYDWHKVAARILEWLEALRPRAEKAA